MHNIAEKMISPFSLMSLPEAIHSMSEPVRDLLLTLAGNHGSLGTTQYLYA